MTVKLLHEDEGLRTYVLVFGAGDEVKSELLRFARQEGVDAAQVSAIGAFSDTTLAYFDWQRKAYEPIPIGEQVEVASFSGNLTTGNGEPKLHAHVVVARRDGSALGGHLLNAHVRPTFEVIVTETPAHLRRVPDRETGLALIDLQESGAGEAAGTRRATRATQAGTVTDIVGEGAASGQPANPSTSSGLRADREEAGEQRRKQYDAGADLVSETD